MPDVVVLDSSAWWEVLHETRVGQRLAKTYLQAPSVRVLTVDLAPAELSSKLARGGREEEIPAVLGSLEAASEIVPIAHEAAVAAGPALARLRQVDRDASLADAVMLTVARHQRATLVSSDPCFERENDVVAF